MFSEGDSVPLNNQDIDKLSKTDCGVVNLSVYLFP